MKPQEAQWFEGYDGQVMLEGDHVWITREDVDPGAVFGFSTEPRRIARDSVVGAAIREATESAFGSLSVLVRGGVAIDAAARHPDVVRFSLGNNSRFKLLHELLSVGESASNDLLTPSTQLVAALETFEGVATATELAGALGAVPIDIGAALTGLVAGVVVCVAGPQFAGRERDCMKSLSSLVGALPPSAGTKQLREAVADTPLSLLTMPRLGALWESLMAERPVKPVSRAPMPAAGSRAGQMKPPRITPPARAVPVVPEAKPAQPRVSANRPIGSPAASPRKIVSAFSGSMLRVVMECEGFRYKALYDPATQSTTVTVAAYRGMLKTRHVSPHAAAEAIITWCSVGAVGPFDGWTLWRFDDGSGRSLGEVRDLRRPQ